jgi:cell division protein ZapB
MPEDARAGGIGGVAARLTAARARQYSRAMSDNAKTALELELKRLEKRIDELVATVTQLKDENRALRQRHESLSGERATLLSKNEQVRARVEAMIGRLKTMEHGA